MWFFPPWMFCLLLARCLLLTTRPKNGGRLLVGWFRCRFEIWDLVLVIQSPGCGPLSCKLNYEIVNLKPNWMQPKAHGGCSFSSMNAGESVKGAWRRRQLQLRRRVAAAQWPTIQPSNHPAIQPTPRPRPVRVSEQTKRAFNIIISYRSRHHIAAELEPLKLGQDDDDDEDEHDSDHLHMSFGPLPRPLWLVYSAAGMSSI